MKLKKVAALGLATAMAFSVTACSSSKPAETAAAAEDAETTAAADGEAVKEAVEGKLKLVFPFISSLITS